MIPWKPTDKLEVVRPRIQMLKPCVTAVQVMRGLGHVEITDFWMDLWKFLPDNVCDYPRSLATEWRGWFLDEIKVPDILVYEWSMYPVQADIDQILHKLWWRTGGPALEMVGCPT